MPTEAHFVPHSEKQQQAILSKKKVVVALTGIQWGKSRVGAWRSKIAMHTYRDKDDCFIVTAPTYDIMQQATLPAFLSIMDGLGKYNVQQRIFEMEHGGKCYFRTETHPDSVVGITNVRHIWGDEAGKYRLYFWQNLQARAAFKDCPITLTTSIYAKNWIYTDLYRPFLEGQMKDVDVYRATSIENPHFPRTEWDRLKRTMDPRRFAMMFGAEFGQMEGLVYDCWDDDQNLIAPFQLPSGTRFIAGIDWGYNPDPFVCSIRAITPSGEHYKVSEFYKTGMTVTDMVAYCRMAKQTWDISHFWADPSQPGYIEEFNRNGCPCSPADNDINRGVSLHYELIKTRKFKIFKGTCPHTIDELQTYHYPEPKDLGPDDDSKEQKPVKQNDHCLDSDRYITMMTFRSPSRHRPKDPDSQKVETQEQRLKRLMRKRAHQPGRPEDFSDY